MSVSLHHAPVAPPVWIWWQVISVSVLLDGQMPLVMPTQMSVCRNPATMQQTALILMMDTSAGKCNNGHLIYNILTDHVGDKNC